MAELARRYDQGPVQLGEVARAQELPLKYLEQLVIPLRRAGLVKGVRGSKGGHMLARSPDEITVWDVMTAVEEGPLTPCSRDAEGCSRAPVCDTREVWCRLEELMARELKTITLSRLIGGEKEESHVQREGDGTLC